MSSRKLIFLIYYIIIFATCYSYNIDESVQIGPKVFTEHIGKDKPVLDNNKDGSPQDVASVSKFIKAFHKQFEAQEPKLFDLEEATQGTEHRDLPSNVNPINESSRINENVSSTSLLDGNKSVAITVDANNNSMSLVNCSNERLLGSLSVELVNSTRLLNLLTPDANITYKTMKADCVVLLFYARTCPFSCIAAPHFNSLPRAFPSIKMAAVNIFAYQSFNTQFGIVGIPTVVLFHNGRPVAKFNYSEYTLENFARFITKYTGIAPQEKMFVTSADFGGPVPSVVAKDTDYLLGLAWLVIAVLGGIAVGKSRAWKSLVEAIQNTWREAEAQHPHEE